MIRWLRTFTALSATLAAAIPVPAASGTPLQSDSQPDLSRAEALLAQAASAFRAAQQVRSPGDQVWAASSLWGTEWRPSPTGETDLWVRKPSATQPSDDYVEPSPESQAAEQAQALRYARDEANIARLEQEGCGYVDDAAQAVRSAWLPGRSGLAGPLKWLVISARPSCEALHLSLLAEIVEVTQSDPQSSADAVRSAVYDQALALHFAIDSDAATKAGVFARLDALDQAALDRLRNDRGPDHPDVADALLTISPFASGTPDQIARFHEAIAIRTRAFGAHDYRTHDAINELASLLGGMGRYDEADALRQSADPELETGENPLDATIGQASVGDLFSLVYASGDFARAQTFALAGFARALEDYDDSSPEVGVAASRMGVVLLARGDFAGAEPFLAKAAEIAATQISPIHKLTLLSDPLEGETIQKALLFSDGYSAALGNLAYVLAAQDKRVEAESIYRQALALRQSVDEATNGSRQTLTLVGLADLLIDRGQTAEGRGLLEEVVRISQSPDYSETGAGIFGRRALAEIYEREGRLAEAEALLRDALSYVEIENTPYEPGPDTGVDLHQNGPPLMTALGRVLALASNHDVAAPLFSRANRAHFRRWCPQGDARFAEGGRYDWTYGNPDCQAHPDFTRAVADQAAFLGEDHAQAATRAWRHAGDMALGRSRVRYSQATDARMDFDADRAVHRAFVASAWTASTP